MSKHTMVAWLNVQRQTEDADYPDATIKVQIDYAYEPGRRASWDDPGHDAELSVLDAKLIDGDGIGIYERAWLLAECQDFLDSDAGHDKACRNAEDER